MNKTTDNQTPLDGHLDYLKLHFFRDNYEPLAKKAAHKQWDHVHYLGELANAEADLRKDRATARRIRAARFPQIKTLEQFNWNWPKKINRMQVENLFRLNFIKEKSNVVFHAVAVSLNEDSLGMVQEPIKQGRRQGSIVVKYLWPIFKGTV